MFCGRDLLPLAIPTTTHTVIVRSVSGRQNTRTNPPILPTTIPITKAVGFPGLISGMELSLLLPINETLKQNYNNGTTNNHCMAGHAHAVDVYAHVPLAMHMQRTCTRMYHWPCTCSGPVRACTTGHAHAADLYAHVPLAMHMQRTCTRMYHWPCTCSGRVRACTTGHAHAADLYAHVPLAMHMQRTCTRMYHWPCTCSARVRACTTGHAHAADLYAHVPLAMHMQRTCTRMYHWPCTCSGRVRACTTGHAHAADVYAHVPLAMHMYHWPCTCSAHVRTCITGHAHAVDMYTHVPLAMYMQCTCTHMYHWPCTCSAHVRTCTTGHAHAVHMYAHVPLAMHMQCTCTHMYHWPCTCTHSRVLSYKYILVKQLSSSEQSVQSHRELHLSLIMLVHWPLEQEYPDLHAMKEKTLSLKMHSHSWRPCRLLTTAKSPKCLLLTLLPIPTYTVKLITLISTLQFPITAIEDVRQTLPISACEASSRALGGWNGSITSHYLLHYVCSYYRPTCSIKCPEKHENDHKPRHRQGATPPPQPRLQRIHACAV